LFGLGAKWKRNQPDRLTRLASAIDALAGRDQKLIDETEHVSALRSRGAADLYAICRRFVDKVNAKLSQPAILLDPPVFREGTYSDSGPNLFQINLRGRLLQLEFEATDELYGHEDFKNPYVLQGTVRSFNQDLLTHNGVDEQLIFYCPDGAAAAWHFFDARTYRTGLISEDYLVSEMERLL
jgi:hypothetical protein